jgi:hypothetical protein
MPVETLRAECREAMRRGQIRDRAVQRYVPVTGRCFAFRGCKEWSLRALVSRALSSNDGGVME